MSQLVSGSEFKPSIGRWRGRWLGRVAIIHGPHIEKDIDTDNENTYNNIHVGQQPRNDDAGFGCADCYEAVVP